MIFLLAMLSLPAARAEALNPRDRITDYSLTNWPEDAGPFPFGVYAIAQDHEGYLWLGTRTGLFRFDGTVFKKWSGSTALPDDRISAIFVARDGSLWLGFGTIGGVTRIRQGAVTNFTAADGLAAGDVNDLVEDDDGVVWAAAYGGLSRFVGDRWEGIGSEHGLPTEPVLSVMKDSRDSLWAGTSRGVYRRRANEDRFQFVAPAMVLGFAEDSSGAIWISDRESGFALLDARPNGEPAVVVKREIPGRYVLYDRSGSLWASSRGSGVWRVRDVATHAASPVVERLTRREGLPSNEIHCLFEDRHGTLWIGTRMGLSRLQESNVHATLAGDDAFVSSVARDPDGSIWIGTSEGVRRRRGDNEHTYGVKDGLPSRIVTALHEDRSGTLWAATRQGIARFTGERFVPLEGTLGGRLGNVWSMTSDRSGVLWICDQLNGLMQWKAGHVTEIDEVVTREGAPHVAYTDANDRVWIGLWTTGVVVYEHQRRRLYLAEDGVPTGTVNVIHQDRKGSVWVGTNNGLARFHNGRFVMFTDNGFPRSAIVSILEDAQGYLWFGLPLGVLRIALEEFEGLKDNPTARLRYKMYGREEGVPGTLGRPGMPSSTRGTDGKLWFVTSVGLAVVDPGKLREASIAAPVKVESVVADGVTVPLGSQVQLPPRTSRIQIEYSMLSLAAVGKLRFRYQLENFDAGWQDAGDLRQASYTNLAPGRYRFHVVSSNSEGGWNESGDVLAFSIRPAVYQTTTFKVAVLVGIVLMTWAAWQLRLRSVQRRLDLVLAERMRVGREVHDTLLQSLVGVALEFDDIREQLDPSAHALRTQVQRIRAQVEHYIREARRSIWNLRSPMLQTCDMPTALRKVSEAALSGSSPVRLDYAVSGSPRRVGTRVEQELLRVGQEAISNAVRHSHAKTITVHLSYESDSVRLRVADDGDGFDLSQIGHNGDGHWGITSMRERAEQIGAQFHLVSSPGEGTSVDVTATPSGAADEWV